MRQNSIDISEYNIEYVLGNTAIVEQMQTIPAKAPFNEQVIEFLNSVAKRLLSGAEAKKYPDVATLGFWMRRGSVEGLKKRFAAENDSVIKVGRGIIFHIAPSNVPVNYAYSLVAGLLCGNKCIVRIPSKNFEQIKIINDAFAEALSVMPEVRPYICLVRYGHDSRINEALSAIADVRVVWGGDNTINELRKAPLKPRATEITFADRYSLAVIQSDTYMSIDNKSRVAVDFYNDTYLTDQNACTSPRAVIWMGERIEEAKEAFWEALHRLLEERYELSGVQAVSKLASGYLLAAKKNGVQKIPMPDNLITRIKVPALTADIMDFKDNSGYFIEYDCADIMELTDFCNDTRCQTLSYIGSVEAIKPLLMSGAAGIDRVVPIGKTMDFDFLWDGYNLYEGMTRNIVLR